MNNKTTERTLDRIKRLGVNIAKQRKIQHLSQNRFAEKLNISREHLAKIETAKRSVSLDLLFDIADALMAQRAYEANLALVNVTKSMAQKAIEIGR